MKGISSLELVLASSIYIVGIFFFIQIISSDVVSYEREIDREVGRSVADAISDVLFESRGVPENWYENPEETKQLGLCKKFTGVCIISEEKLDSLSLLDTEKAKELLNLKNYSFRVLIKDMDNNPIFDYNSSEISEWVKMSEKKCLNESLSRVRAIVEVW